MAQYVNEALGTDSTAVAAVTSACTIRAVRLYLEGDETAADLWVNIWNVAQGDVTVGTTVPDFILFAPYSSGRNGKLLYTYIFPGDGLFLGTALTEFVSDTGGNNVSAATIDTRLVIDYNPSI